jgi:L-lactate dehydrogenase
MSAIYEEVTGNSKDVYYGIAMAVGRIAESLVKDEHAVLPVSVVLEGEYGLEGLALSIPSIVGREGLEEVLEIPLSGEEAQALRQSAKQMEEAIASLNL